MNKELLDEKLKNREQLILQQNEKISALEKETEELRDALEKIKKAQEIAAGPTAKNFSTTWLIASSTLSKYPKKEKS